MAQLQPTYYVDPASASSREAEATAADFKAGMNLSGSNAPGIGINMEAGAVVGTPEQFTLLDQAGAVREPQASQFIGGPGYSAAGTSAGQEGALPGKAILSGPNTAAGDGAITSNGDANLETLANGWVLTAVVP